jgi:hypothetical protein
MRPPAARRLDEANEIEIALRREDLYDRRWTRHRDQLLTAAGIAGLVAALALGMPVLSAATVLPAGPRAAQWFRNLMVSGDARANPYAPKRP